MDKDLIRALGALEGKVEAMHADLVEVKADVKDLKGFKNRFYGAAAAISFVVSWLSGLFKSLL